MWKLHALLIAITAIGGLICLGLGLFVYRMPQTARPQGKRQYTGRKLREEPSLRTLQYRGTARHTVYQCLSIVMMVLLGLHASTSSGQEGDFVGNTFLGSTTPITRRYSNLPLWFEANHGQTDAQVTFFTRGNSYTLFLTATEAVLVARSSFEATDTLAAPPILRMQLVDANPTPQITGVEALPGPACAFDQKPTVWQ